MGLGIILSKQTLTNTPFKEYAVRVNQIAVQLFDPGTLQAALKWRPGKIRRGLVLLERVRTTGLLKFLLTLLLAPESVVIV